MFKVCLQKEAGLPRGRLYKCTDFGPLPGVKDTKAKPSDKAQFELGKGEPRNFPKRQGETMTSAP